MKRSWWWVPLAFGAAVVVGGVVWSLIPADNGRHLPATRARGYRAGRGGMERSGWWVPLALGAAVVVGGVVWSLIPADNGRHLPPTRARAYRDVSACLLTGGRGIADPQAAAAWSGMEDASATT